MATKNSKKRARLEEWTAALHPQYRDLVLYGRSYNHNGIEDSHRIITSPVIEIDLINNTAETRNTIYELGSRSEAVYEHCKKLYEDIQQHRKSDSSVQ